MFATTELGRPLGIPARRAACGLSRCRGAPNCFLLEILARRLLRRQPARVKICHPSNGERLPGKRGGGGGGDGAELRIQFATPATAVRANQNLEFNLRSTFGALRVVIYVWIDYRAAPNGSLAVRAAPSLIQSDAHLKRSGGGGGASAFL